MSGVEITGVVGGLVSSLYVERYPDGLVTVTVRSRGATIGKLVTNARDLPLLMSRLLGDVALEDTKPGGVLDRIVSLVQSLANHGYPESREQVDVFIDEAHEIAKLAGWT